MEAAPAEPSRVLDPEITQSSLGLIGPSAVLLCLIHPRGL